MQTLLKKIIIAAVFLTAGAGVLFAGSRVAFQQFYPASGVSGVLIDVRSEEVEIGLWNRNEFRVTVVNDYNEYPEISLSNGILRCEERSGGIRHRCLLEIKVPESFYAKSAYGGWSIKTNTGSINASKLWGETISIESDTGSITLSKCEAQVAEVNCDTGRISLSQCIISDMLSIFSDTGSVSFDGTAAGIIADCDTGSVNISLDQLPVHDCEITNCTGSITVSLPENPGFKFVFATDTGSVYNSFTGYSGGKTGIDSYGTGYVIIRAETDTGSIRILKR